MFVLLKRNVGVSEKLVNQEAREKEKEKEESSVHCSRQVDEGGKSRRRVVRLAIRAAIEINAFTVCRSSVSRLLRILSPSSLLVN